MRIRSVSALAVVAAVLAVAACSSANPPDHAAGPSGVGVPSAGPAGSGVPGSVATAGQPPASPSGAAAGGCPILPAGDIWHADVSGLAVDRSSAAYVASMGATRHAHPDFGAGLIDGQPFGFPVTVVPPGQAGVTVRFEYAGESDKGPYPVPGNARIEGGPSADGDRHVLLYDPVGCRSYELYAAYPNPDGSWRAGSGARYDLRSSALRPAGWTSADAAGLPILPGLVRYEEVAAGRVDHAIRITADRTSNRYCWPARHAASSATDPALPPMGTRFRLRAGVDVSRFPTQARVIAEALKRHGAILADNGSSWYLSGTQDDRWSNEALNALKTLTGSDFEVVDATPLMVDPNSGATAR